MKHQSMTGYGKGVAGSIKAEARSINHKHLDIQIKLPSFLYSYENEIRKLIKSKFERGHVEVSISRAEAEALQIKINKTLAKEYHAALSELKNELNLSGDIDIKTLASYRDIFSFEEETKSEELTAAVETALQELEKMRIEEGRVLINDITDRVRLISRDISVIEERRNLVINDIRQKLRDRLEEFLKGITVDESRLVQEAAILTERSDITEEIVRVKSHLNHIDEVFRTDGAVGKKLDFLVQELRREVNTIGSKTTDSDIVNKIITMKHEIEKIKEQLQNLQ